MVENGGVVSSCDLLHVVVTMERKLTNIGAEQFLKTLKEDQWLTEVRIIQCAFRYVTTSPFVAPAKV